VHERGVETDFMLTFLKEVGCALILA